MAEKALYACSWNGCIPVTIRASSPEDAAQSFAQDAQNRGHEGVRAEDVEVEEA